MRFRVPTVAALAAMLGACGAPDAAPVTAPAADLLVSVRASSIVAPDTIQPGWARVRVEEDGAGHILVIFRLPETATDSAVTSFLLALDTAQATPAPGMALGGPEIGDTGEVIVQLTPGRYLLGCVRRGPDRYRHASTGESKVLVVTNGAPAAGREAPPVATQELGLVDFAYVGPDRWVAGQHLLRIVNDGKQDHQLRLIQLPPGASLNDWITAEDPGEVGTLVSGVARMGPGAVAYLPVELPAATYVAYCLITDPVSRQEHVEMGMVREIHVGR